MAKKSKAEIAAVGPAPKLWEIELRDPRTLKPHPKNPRTHPEAQVEGLGGAMQEFGLTSVLVVDEKDRILAGHARTDGAIRKGAPKVQVIVVRGWTEAKKLKFMLADNRWPELAGYDDARLREIITSLQQGGEDLAVAGYDPAALAELLASANFGQSDPEDIPEPPKKPVVRKGDLWVLGQHRLFCGDSTKADDVEKVVGGGGMADLTFTDPPYNVAYSGRGQNKRGPIKNDDQTDAAFEKFLDAAFVQMAAAMKPLASIYVCHPDAASAPKLAYERAFAAHFQKSATIIWVKNAAGMGWQDYRSQHEPMLYGWKTGKGKHHFYGDRTKTTVWDISRDAQATYEHPTQKPVALASEAITNSSRKGQLVFDPFIGAGATLIACETLGRKCVAIEMDARYVEVVILRWQKFTGKLATLDGHTLEQVGKTRRTGRAKGTIDATKGGASATKPRKSAPVRSP